MGTPWGAAIRDVGASIATEWQCTHPALNNEKREYPQPPHWQFSKEIKNKTKIFKKTKSKQQQKQNPLKPALESLVCAHIFLLTNSREEYFLDKKASWALPQEGQET